MFRRAVAFGPFGPAAAEQFETARLSVDGEPVADGQADLEVAARLCAAARALVAVGMRLHAGDLLITGLVVNEPVSPGDRVASEIGAVGRAELVIDAAY